MRIDLVDRQIQWLSVSSQRRCSSRARVALSGKKLPLHLGFMRGAVVARIGYFDAIVPAGILAGMRAGLNTM